MKRILFIYFLIFTSFSYGQNLSKKVGEIEVQLIGHYFNRNSDYELTKRKSNQRNRPYAKLYFDSTGILLKGVYFGKHHNNNLRLTDKIEVYKYSNNKLTESISYESDYEKNVYPYWKTKFIYNDKGQLIDNSKFYYKTDSLFHKTTYKYDLNSNNTKSIFNPTYYYQREFDSINRITSLKQVYDNELRWEWNYTYSNNKRIGIFQTYYNDGKDYSKKEIKIYNKNGQLIESEDKYTSKLDTGDKMKIYYEKNGLITKIEYYEIHSFNKEYKMTSFTDIEVKSKLDFDFQLSERINEQIELTD